MSKTLTTSLVVGFAMLASVSYAQGQVPSAQTQGRFEETIIVTATPKPGAASDHYMTFSGPVGIPGVTLPAGEYLFRFPAENTKDVIQVLKADRSNAYAMFHTIPVQDLERDVSSDQHDVTWRERRAGAPMSIKAWFVPGRKVGYEFIYPTASEGNQTAVTMTPIARFEEAVVVTAAARPGAASEYFLTFNRAVGIPGMTLAPGAYLFRFPVGTANGVIQVMKPDRSNAYVMFHTIPVHDVQRSESSDSQVVMWRNREAGAPPSIKTWYLPGRTAGYEFVYSKDKTN